MGAIYEQKEVGKAVVVRSNESGAVGSKWQSESPYQEALELMRVMSDLRLDGTFMR